MPEPKTFGEFLDSQKVSRRSLLKFAGIMAASLALPVSFGQTIAQALAVTPRLPIIWLEFQDCTGDTEAFLRASSRPDPLQSGKTDPDLISLLLDYLSVDYHETLMTGAGFQAEKSLADTMAVRAGKYITIVEGSIPTAAGGTFCTIAGRTALAIAQDVIPKGLATIALGSCAWDGGLAAAAPNPTGAVGVLQAVPNAPNLLALPGCPVNVVNLVASLVYFLSFNAWPTMESSTRLPRFAYSTEIHERCERKIYYKANQFVQSWGDAGAKAGWCLIKMGCRGPATKSNCYLEKFNGGTNWPIGAGAPCIGCVTAKFWDKQAPFYTARGD